MKELIPLLFLLTLIACQGAYNSTAKTEQPTAEPTTVFDEVLAMKLGADEYGMAQYVMAFLKAGPNRSQDSTTRMELQAAHLANISRMADAGQLVLAGPFLDGGDIKGIYIFAVESVEEAKELTSTDPAIQAGSLIMEMHPWYGSAALKQLTGIHNRIQKTAF